MGYAEDAAHATWMNSRSSLDGSAPLTKARRDSSAGAIRKPSTNGKKEVGSGAAAEVIQA